MLSSRLGCIKQLLFASLIAALFATAAPARAQNSAADWAGFSFGLQLGYATGHADWSAGGDSAHPTVNGLIGGFSAAYRYALTQQFLLGGLFMAGLADSNGDRVCSGGDFKCRSFLSAYALMAAQGGFAFERFLIYANLGFVMARLHHRGISTVDSFLNESSQRHWRTGLAAGLAMEYLLFANTSIGFQYWYWDFARRHNRFTQDTTPANSQEIGIRMAQHIFMLTLTYNFYAAPR